MLSDEYYVPTKSSYQNTFKPPLIPNKINNHSEKENSGDPNFFSTE